MGQTDLQDSELGGKGEMGIRAGERLGGGHDRRTITFEKYIDHTNIDIHCTNMKCIDRTNHTG